MKATKVLSLLMLLVSLYSCKQVIVKEGEKFILKRTFRNNINITNSLEKSFFKSRMKEKPFYVLQTNDIIALKDLQESRKKVNVFSLLPKNALEEAKIFGKSSQHGTYLSNSSYESFKNEESILQAIAGAEKESTAIVIGHNENGKLILGDGSNISFSKLDRLFLKKRITPIYLSCKSSKFTINAATDYLLNGKEAENLAKILEMNIIKGINRQNIDEIINCFNKLRNYKNQAYYVKRVSIGGGAISAYYLSKKI